MRRRSPWSWLGAAVFLLGATAHADERALFVAPGLASDEAASVAAALRTEHSVEAIDEARARVLLTEQAAALPPDRVAEATAAALDEAEQAWADLHLDGARSILDRALSALLGAPRPPSTSLVARALFVRSLIDDAAGQRALAARALDAALALDDSLTPSPDRHGPPVARAVEAARQRGHAAPDATLRITVTPATADVEVDGAPTTAREVRVATGPHLVVARHLGNRPAARLVEVAGVATCEMALEPAPAALAATQALAALEAGAPFGDVAPVAARALGISRVLEAVAGEAGSLELRVWSASG